MSSRNFFFEISENIKITDIDYVLVHGKKVDSKWFLEQAKRIDYDDSWGGVIITTELIIVMKDGTWLERCEYDGSEWFEHREKPVTNENHESKDIAILFCGGHDMKYNTCKIDGQNIDDSKRVPGEKTYRFWVEKDGGIEIIERKWVDGNYQKRDRKLLDDGYDVDIEYESEKEEDYRKLDFRDGENA